jgi:hypothetical protein
MNGLASAQRMAYTMDDETYGYSWSIEQSPNACFADVTIADFFEFDDESSAKCGIVRYRSRQSDGSDKTTTLPGLDYFERVHVIYDARLTSVTYRIQVKNASSVALWSISYWG